MKNVKFQVGLLGVIALVVFISSGAHNAFLIRESTAYTKSGNCDGASLSTLRFNSEPTARMFPEEIWIEECPTGNALSPRKFFLKIGDGNWKEITKEDADSSAGILSSAGRRAIRIVD